MSKELENINLDDYKNIEVEMNDIKKAKMKKTLRKEIIRRKGRKRKTVAIVASLTFIMTLGIISQPAIAQNIPLINTMYQKMGFSEKYLPVTKYVGESVEENGIKVTVDNIAASQRAIIVSIKVEAKNEIFENPSSLIHISGSVNGISVGSGGSAYNIDKKNYVQVMELSSIEGFPSTGTLKLDIFSETYKINKSIELNIDFNDSYKNNIKKEVTMESNNGEYKVVELEGTSLGTFLKVENCKIEGGDGSKGILLKIDDKIYRNGSFSSDGEIAYLSCPDVVYDDIKNAKNISAIEYKNEDGAVVFGGGVKSTLVNSEWVSVPTMTEEETEVKNKLFVEYMEKERIAKESSPKKIKDNVEYISELISQDGNKVNITNVERKDGKIKIYIDGDERNDILRVANDTFICDDNNKNYQFPELIRENREGYIIEFEDSIEGKVKVDMKDMLINKHGLRFEEEEKLILK
ncbi:DUF4179 domain-containing protein [Clostridium gasigenes]|uniref:DUF4179 domain-containing protein n=1 Tax=Clostridium gasigenes TaxID=94869 RepID=UPI00143853CB|nr:DUF4179 domain-containing protein [Clostridium gasigenes]NKF07593.1 DUF4179 domain-containing protein [Clostridium gasigenes]QSW18022.1 DUF4179 domain-containing protein [Clostridium gasigenes]